MEQRIKIMVQNVLLSLTDAELGDLSLLVHDEVQRRDDLKISCGAYPAVTPDIHQEMTKTDVMWNKLIGIKLYYNRHRDLGLRVAKRVIDKYVEDCEAKEALGPAEEFGKTK